MASDDGNRNKATNETEVEDNREEGEEGNAAEAEGQNDAEDGVEDGSTGHALNGLPSLGDGQMVVREDGKEVGEDTQYEDGSKQLDAANDCLAKAQSNTTERHVDR